MAKNILVIGVDLRETRVALIEDGVIAEMHIERQGAKLSTVGNVYLGKVTRVLPGLQAAFIDIGQERAAFLHVEDLIRPDDFEAYLAGGLKTMRNDDDKLVGSSDESDDGDDEVLVPITHMATEVGEVQAAAPEVLAAHPVTLEPAVDTGESEHELPDAGPSSAHLPLSADSAVHVSAAVDEQSPASSPESARVAVPAAASSFALTQRTGEPSLLVDSDPFRHVEALSSHDVISVQDALNEDDDEDAPSDEDEIDPADIDPLDAALLQGARVQAPAAPRGGRHAAARATTPTLDDDFFDLPGFTISDPGEAVPRAGSPRGGQGHSGGDAGRRRGRGGRRGGGDSGNPNARQGRSDSRQEHRQAAPQPALNPNRITKATPIADVVKEGQDVIVQVTKDTIGTKGARCSSHISLPGRYVVYLPTVEHVGVSKRIGNDKERSRLREVIDSVKPPTGGLVVRTVAEGLTKKQLKQDVGYLVRLWGEVAKKHEGAKAPTLLAGELDLTLKVARDLFTDEVDAIVIDDRVQYERLYRFLEVFAPDRLKDIQLYSGEEPIFDAYGIETEIKRALDRNVRLPSGGYLVIDQAEALTAIDVNTGRFVGKGSKDMEETILKTNLEAVHEIAYQLRFRNLGGLIILDLIDMEKMSNREKVRRTLEELLQKDKAKTTLNRISELGLIEMTRKRTRESLGRYLHEPCFYCDGTGQLQSKETVAY